MLFEHSCHKFQSIKKIGEGGFGEVFLVKRLSDGKFFALKRVLSPIARRELLGLRRFFKIANISRKNFPMVEISDFWESEGDLYYTMPIADGYDSCISPESPLWSPMSLYSLIESREKYPKWFSAKEVEKIMSPIFDAAMVLAENSLLHRDIKPNNILFFGGEAKLADIGLLTEDTPKVSALGTPDFQPPSWYLHTHGDADMWGIATTLYTLITGFSPDTMGREAYRFPKQNVAYIGEGEFDRWLHWHSCILRATHEKASERFKNIAEFKTTFLSDKIDIATDVPKSLHKSNALKIVVSAVIFAGILFFGKIFFIPQETAHSDDPETKMNEEQKSVGGFPLIAKHPNGNFSIMDDSGNIVVITSRLPYDRIFPKIFGNKIYYNENVYLRDLILNGKNAQKDMDKIFKFGAKSKDWGISIAEYNIMSYTEYLNYWRNKRDEDIAEELKSINGIKTDKWYENKLSKSSYLDYLKESYVSFISYLAVDRWLMNSMKNGYKIPVQLGKNFSTEDYEVPTFETFKNYWSERFKEIEKKYKKIGELPNDNNRFFGPTGDNSVRIDYHYISDLLKDPLTKYFELYKRVYKEVRIYEISKYTNIDN